MSKYTYTWKPNPPDWVLSWIACFVDSEGSIYANHRYQGSSAVSIYAKLCIGVTLVSTDRCLLEFITNWFDCKIYAHPGTKRPAYRIFISGSRAIKRFLIPIKPYLLAKQYQAGLALEIVGTFEDSAMRTCRSIPPKMGEKRLQAWKKLRDANHFCPGTRKDPKELEVSHSISH